MAREGNRPNRRFANVDLLDVDERKALAKRLIYVGSAHHKRSPGDYGFNPPANPRASKSLCDGKRVIKKTEAKRIFRKGILKGMFSTFEAEGSPKFVWCVGGDGEVYEAKIDRDGYHGYPINNEDDMRTLVLKEWEKR